MILLVFAPPPQSQDSDDPTPMQWWGKAFWWSVLWWMGLLSMVAMFAFADYGMREILNRKSGPPPEVLRGSGEVGR